MPQRNSTNKRKITQAVKTTPHIRGKVNHFGTEYRKTPLPADKKGPVREVQQSTRRRREVTKEQHKDLCNILQGASVTLHIILLGVGGTIYNTHTLKPFKELGPILKALRSLPPSSMCTL